MNWSDGAEDEEVSEPDTESAGLVFTLTEKEKRNSEPWAHFCVIMSEQILDK